MDADGARIDAFIESCKQAQRVFEEWVNHCAVERITSDFNQMAEILKHLQTAIEKAEKIKTSP